MNRTAADGAVVTVVPDPRTPGLFAVDCTACGQVFYEVSSEASAQQGAAIHADWHDLPAEALG